MIQKVGDLLACIYFFFCILNDLSISAKNRLKGTRIQELIFANVCYKRFQINLTVEM